MEAVTVPPFERFYEEQREPVLAQLRRMLGRDAADDAFQETFLRTLRAYPALKHGQHLRAWALAIARNVAIDAYRRERATSADVPDLESVDEPLPYEELRRLTADLPQKERAAVFLRFGYDLSYEDIGDGPRLVVRGGSPGHFLRCPPTAQEGALMTVSPELDARFRDAAAAEGLLDVAYDFADTPVGRLLVAVTDRGLCEISYDPSRSASSSSSLAASAPGCCARRGPRDETRRQLDEYFAGERREFDLPVDLRLARDFGRTVLRRARPRPLRRADHLRRAGREGRPPPRRPRGRHGHEPEPCADRAPMPPGRRLDRLADRLRRRARPQAHAARAGGRYRI